MPTRPAAAPETQSTPAPGYCSEPARTPTTPRVYLWASGAGPRQQRARRRRSCSASTAGAGRSRPMSTRCTTPQAIAAGSTRWATLWVPKVTVTSARDVRAVDPTGVDVDARTGRPRRRPGRPSTAAHRRRGVVAQPAAAADADDPVDHDVGRRGLADDADDPAAGAAQRGEPAGVGLRSGRAAAPRTGTPRRASSAPAYSASPPLSPDPTSSSTRRAVRRGRAGRARRTPARPRPAASARPRAAGPSAPPRPPGPARRCVRCACRSSYRASRAGHGSRDEPRPSPVRRCRDAVPTTHGQVISAQTASRMPSGRERRTPATARAGRAATPRRACGRGSRS